MSLPLRPPFRAFRHLAFVFVVLSGLPRLASAQGLTASDLALHSRQAAQNGDFPKARELMEQAVHREPANARYQAELGELEWKAGDQQSALERFEHAITLKGADLTIRSRLAQLYWSLGRDLDVLRVLKATPVGEPSRSMWRFSRGLSLFRLGRLNEAQLQLSPLTTHSEFGRPANFFLGRIAYAQNRFSEALPFFARSVRPGKSGQDVNAYRYDYGLTLFRLGRYSDALTQFTLATEHYPSQPSPWMMRGRCEEELGQPQSAIASYEKSIQLDDKYQITYYHLARLHQRYGDKARASQLFERLGELKQNDITAQEERALKLKTGEERATPPETGIR